MKLVQLNELSYYNMDHDEFIKLLEEKFCNNGTFLKPGAACKESVMNIIKSTLLKKNLVIINKSELEKLQK